MEIKQIIKNIKDAKNVNDIVKTLKDATIFGYTKVALDEQYDYQLRDENQTTETPARCIDMENNPVDLADVKDAVLAIIAK